MTEQPKPTVEPIFAFGRWSGRNSKRKVLSLVAGGLLAACAHPAADPAAIPATAATASGSLGAASGAHPEARDEGSGEVAAEEHLGEVTEEEETDLAAAVVEEEIGPPDGEWLVDEDGKEYYIREVPREEGAYRLLPGDRVALPPGLVYHLAEVRDDVFAVKIFRTRNEEKRRRSGPSAEKMEQIRASYAVALPESDHLRLVPFDEGLPRRGQWREGFAVADVDRDGHPDIVHGPPRKGTGRPFIFRGDGKGRWQAWSQARFTGETLDYGDVAVADFNGDGHADIAFAVHLRGLQVMVGDGQGGFQSWGEGLDYWTGGDDAFPDFSTRSVTAVDWNGDGLPDLLALGEGPRLARSGTKGPPEFSRGSQGPVLFLNQGDGTWKRYDQGTGRDQNFGGNLALADFDGDGYLDFATSSNTPGLQTILHFGRADGGWDRRDLALLRPGVSPAIEAADFDGDGRAELVVGYAAAERLPGTTWFTGVDLFHLEPDGSWRRQALASVEGSKNGVWALASGDVDGDGYRDLVALTGTGAGWLFLGSEGGLVRETSPELAPREWGCKGSRARLVDLDGDKRDELVLAFAGETGSEILFPDARPRCPSGGSLQVWKAQTPERPGE